MHADDRTVLIGNLAEMRDAAAEMLASVKTETDAATVLAVMQRESALLTQALSAFMVARATIEAKLELQLEIAKVEQSVLASIEVPDELHEWTIDAARTTFKQDDAENEYGWWAHAQARRVIYLVHEVLKLREATP